jgi:hypothetical protein
MRRAIGGPEGKPRAAISVITIEAVPPAMRPGEQASQAGALVPA